ncbi:lysM domain receptor-like kinase 3 [Pyrus ussuriensis x Pyrus communis]|uniref:LysM domain receptor-like kinase 3 n=1 Tax=Pyrus ussuriensis x Pyrus communis TaxID=2448454 RepID=A0A5N5I477_9ROSA|nr:lysM domain receptor-like kinase 3 [Pyrus ussuriensis x Pyrus communis]
MEMAPLNQKFHFFSILFTIFFYTNVLSDNTIGVHPFPCSTSHHTQTCNSSLYHISKGHQIEEIATFYSVNPSNIKPIVHDDQHPKDYLVSVPCTCKDIKGTQVYLYDTNYLVKEGDTVGNVVSEFYSGQAVKIGEEEQQFTVGNMTTFHLVCGCVEKKSQEVVTYTVQDHDTLSDIENLLSAYESEIQKLNKNFTKSPNFIDVGWVLFVPMELNGLRAQQQGKRLSLATIIGIVSAVGFLLVVTFTIFLLIRYRKGKNTEEDVNSNAKNVSLKQQFFKRQMEETFENERPVIYTMEEIEQATNNFDDTRKIGQGGYGSVAVKKMRSSRSKEFFAELKVLCKIHHNNVVELLGYASGSEHLCLVYEFVRNGSLNDHLHDPLLKGNQPLSWTARAQIALDTARGIEYIHDHTKTRYVHRDIKTSNILLDQGLRAKVADFGLARLVERSNEEDIIATRVVGTPGYIPPESVRELQMTSKTDVYAFGVVVAELITGQRAIFCDNREPKRMKSLISVIYAIFKEEDPEAALEAQIDGNMKGSYPMEEVYKMAKIAWGCASEDPVNRPEMKDIVQTLSQILMSSIEWEASLGGKSEGRVLIWRDYRGDVSAAQAERFFTKFIEKEGDPQSQDPVVYDNGVTYMFIQHNNIYLMIASRQNCNAASLLLFLHRVIDVFKHYFEELEEESLRDNFVVVYELLDEIMDFGFPQFTEAKILSEFIKTDAYRMEVTQRPPMAVTNAVSWRSEGIQYKKNEVFLDVVESVNILVNSIGQIIRSDVVGALKMRTYLSGMPECKLGLNDRVLLEAQGQTSKGKSIDLDDIKFHQCVRLSRFENDRTISFIPPDGAFDLMTYRLSTQVKPLIWVEAQVENHSRSRIEFTVKARSQYKERSTATNVEIELPVPADATNPNVRTSIGSAKYAPERDALVWKIKSFPGNKEYMLRSEFTLPSITAEEAVPERRAPIRVKFEIPYFTVSGIQVRYLKIIEKSGYQALPWVRYITMAGEYELRLM